MAKLKTLRLGSALSAVVFSVALMSCGPQQPAEEAPAAEAEAPVAQSFAGKWGRDAAQCALAQDAEDAPMVFTESGYDQHETHCSFNSVTEWEAGVWNAIGACTAEGAEQPTNIVLAIEGDRLTINPGVAPQELVRCP
jgi:hypothetical protein